jgi:pimeloyl-ACP methyl ester carboxylesterase
MTEFIEANGLRIGYDVHGEGPPMVLLHGAASSGREDWAAQVPMFSKAFRIFLPDARGHATTRWDTRQGLSYGALVDDLGALVDALGLETFHLVGFSMGGVIALTWATRNAHRLLSLLVAGTALEREPRLGIVTRAMDPDRRPETGPLSAAALGRRHDAGQGSGAWRNLLTAIAADLPRQAPLTPAEIRRIDCPALVAVGDRDPFVPVDHAWNLMRLLPDGRLLVLPDTPHELMVRRAGLFNEAAMGFYRSLAGAARRPVGRGSVDEPMATADAAS